MVHEKGTELGWLVQSADNRLKHFGEVGLQATGRKMQSARDT